MNWAVRPAEDGPDWRKRWPEVHDLASRVAALSGAPRMLVLQGAGTGLSARVEETPSNVTVVRCATITGRANDSATWRWDSARLTSADAVMSDPLVELAEDAVVVCVDWLEGLQEPASWLRGLSRLATRCRFLLLTTPARDRQEEGASESSGRPSPEHRWTLSEFVAVVRSAGLKAPLLGYTRRMSDTLSKTGVLIIDGSEACPPGGRTAWMAPCAIVKAYNDNDFIAYSVSQLRHQGLRVHVIDNWSTDGTYETLAALASSDAGVTHERFPDAPQLEYQWRELLVRSVEVSEDRGQGWYVHVDSDELRESPWHGITLAEALRFVDSLGYTAVDFTVLDFRYLLDDGVGARPWERMLHFEFGRRPGHFRQIKAWKYFGQLVDLASTGGHEACFDGRRVYPLKFLLRHFPLRGPHHAWRKIFQERLPRVECERSRYGWHVQYDGVSPERLAGWRRDELIGWSSASFETEYLVERLSGIGLVP